MGLISRVSSRTYRNKKKPQNVWPLYAHRVSRFLPQCNLYSSRAAISSEIRFGTKRSASSGFWRSGAVVEAKISTFYHISANGHAVPADFHKYRHDYHSNFIRINPKYQKT